MRTILIFIYTGGRFHAQLQRVLRDSAIDKVKNTNRAMDPKMLEFKQFCASVYGNQGYLTQIVTEEKAFAFLFYHAYREKKEKKRDYLAQIVRYRGLTGLIMTRS